MTTYQYCTPEWLSESLKNYRENSKLKETFKRLIMKIAFRITADPTLGIDQDIIFAAYMNQGEIEKLAFVSKAEAENEAEYILSSSPRQWSQLLRKETMFAGEVMMGRIAIDKGSKPGVIRIAPYSTAFVDALTQIDVQYPDEMSVDEIEKYRETLHQFRAELGV
jgi:putative sterol carrier protein